MAKKRKIITLLLTCLIMSLFTIPAFAANGPYETDASIAVSVEGGGKVEIEPVNGAPEPDNGTVLEVKSGETKTFDFHFTQPCDLEYKVREIAGNDENTIYDDREYTAYLFVEASDEGLRPIYAFEVNGEKSDSIVFKNSLKNLPKAGPVQTSDSSTYILYVGCVIALIAMIACIEVKRRESEEYE